MRALLRYCYQGQLDAETMEGEWTVEIFTLACKYRIDNLKALLQKHYIEKKLSVGNVVGMAALADTYSAEKLKEVGYFGKLFATRRTAASTLPPIRSRHASS